MTFCVGRVAESQDLNVRLWHKADIQLQVSAPSTERPLSGVKRTLDCTGRMGQNLANLVTK